MSQITFGLYEDTWLRCQRDSEQDLQGAIYVLGVQGSGKSTLLANLAEQLSRAGEGVLVIDTKGELAEDIAGRTQQLDKLVYVAPGMHLQPGQERYWGLNPLEFDRAQPHLAADH